MEKKRYQSKISFVVIRDITLYLKKTTEIRRSGDFVRSPPKNFDVEKANCERKISISIKINQFSYENTVDSLVNSKKTMNRISGIRQTLKQC